MPTINERRVKSFFTDSGWHVHDVSSNRHWKVWASKDDGPVLRFVVSASPRRRWPLTSSGPNVVTTTGSACDDEQVREVRR